MKAVDVIFALIVGRALGFIIDDFLEEWGIHAGIYEHIFLWLALPLFTVFCLWIAYHIGKRLLFIYQVAKHLLVGALATVIDLKIFEFLVWIFSLFFTTMPLVAKSISFVFAIS